MQTPQKVSYKSWVITNDRFSDVGCGGTQNRPGQTYREWGSIEKLEDPIVRIDLVKFELFFHDGKQVGGHLSTFSLTGPLEFQFLRKRLINL